jgi:MFS family permease
VDLYGTLLHKAFSESYVFDFNSNSTSVEPSPKTPRQSTTIFRFPDYRRYWFGGIFASAGAQMTNVAAGFELYERTHQPWSLGLLGLVIALPVILLALPAGTLADRIPRRKIVVIGEFCAALALALLALVSYTNAPLVLFYACIFLASVANAFVGPALGAIVTNIVPRDEIPIAIKLGSIRGQIASTLGPVLGGIIIHKAAGSAFPVFILDCLGRCLFTFLLWQMRPAPQEKSKEQMNWASVVAGWDFVKSNPLILSTISLDMVAVLFGGATAMLPIYAKDILHVGPEGLGYLRAAPAVGAISMGLFLANRPPLRRAGRALLIAVAGFGLATIVFGTSRNFVLSMGALAVLGAFDNISVVVRHTLLNLLTPDSMRGRVNAVNSVFIGTSNEIGELESGLAAQAVGPVMAVAGGGVITIVVVGFVAVYWPAIRKLRRLEDLPQL